MFYKATKFNSQICNWNLDGKVITEMFTGSLCSIASCITCSQSPCPDSVVLNDNNVKEKVSDYSSDKEAIKCFDTSLVINMTDLFLNFSDVNADLSSWDVSSVLEMAVSYQV